MCMDYDWTGRAYVKLSCMRIAKTVLKVIKGSKKLVWLILMMALGAVHKWRHHFRRVLLQTNHVLRVHCLLSKHGWSEVKTVDTRQNDDAIYEQPLMIIILISRTCFELPQLQSCSRLHHVELEMAKFGGSAAGFCINVAFSNQHILSLSGYILI